MNHVAFNAQLAELPSEGGFVHTPGFQKNPWRAGAPLFLHGYGAHQNLSGVSVLLPLAEVRKLEMKAQYLFFLLCADMVEVSTGKADIPISSIRDLRLSRPWNQDCSSLLVLS